MPELPESDGRTSRRSKAARRTAEAPCPHQVKREAPSPSVQKSHSSLGMLKLVGAHVSAAGGVHNAVSEAVAIGANAFALFLRSQRTWHSKPLSADVAEKFKAACEEHRFPPHAILPHGSYLMNLGSPDEGTLMKSRQALIDEMKRCEMLGLTKYNFHPGSTCGKIPVDECIGRIVESINSALDQTSGVTAVVENMSCQGNTIGGRFQELHAIVSGIKDKSRIGVCLDTCHAFAAGYDLRSKESFQAVLEEFEKVVGFEYLQGVHLNDSKGDLGCHLDRHENIGMGKLGKDAFRWLMNDPRFNGIPLILETPGGVGYDKEIRLLRSLEE